VSPRLYRRGQAVIVLHPGQQMIKVALLAGPTISLEDLYSICGSPVQALRLAPRITLWCNEEGRLNGMSPNVVIPPGHLIFGPCLIARDTPTGNTVACRRRTSRGGWKSPRAGHCPAGAFGPDPAPA
jgi:hypothetical protein